jgi:hypothetical protein
MFCTHGDKTIIRQILYLSLVFVKLHRGSHSVGVRATFCLSLEKAITPYSMLLEVAFIFLWRFDRFRVMVSNMTSRSHSLDKPHSVELPWMSDQFDEETANDTQHSQEPDIHALARLKPAFPASERLQTERPLGSAWTVMADSHIPCHSHAVPLRVLIVSFPIWFSECGRVWFTHAKPFPCHAKNMSFWKRPLKATAGVQHGVCELASAVQRRHVGNLPAFDTVGEWQGSDRVVAGSRHGMCESVLSLQAVLAPSLTDWMHLCKPDFAANTTSLSQCISYQHIWLRHFFFDHTNVIFCYWHEIAQNKYRIGKLYKNLKAMQNVPLSHTHTHTHTACIWNVT